MADTGFPQQTDDERFAASVKRLREERGWSQGELARRMSEAGFDGFHQTTISRIEKGERPVRIGEAHGLARVLDTMVGTMIAPGELWRAIDEVKSDYAAVVNEMGRLYDAAYNLLGAQNLLRRSVEKLDDLEQFGDLEPQLAEWAKLAQEQAKSNLLRTPRELAEQATESWTAVNTDGQAG